MALKVELKPHERIIVGNCVITNTDQRARLLIDGDKIPILREKDILTPETADTPAKLVYLAVQLMYISPDPQVNHGVYFNLVRDIVTAAPSAWPIIEGINNNILNGEIVADIHESGIAAPSTTVLDGKLAIRAAIVNHRTDVCDIDALISAVLEFGARRSGSADVAIVDVEQSPPLAMSAQTP